MESKSMSITHHSKSAGWGGFSAATLGAVAAVCLFTLPARAASTDTWLGNTSANFSASANWTYSAGSGPVASGDSLVFGAAGIAGTTLNDDIGGMPLFTGITFNTGASAFTLGGNAFTLGTGTAATVITVNNTTNVINNSFTLGNANQTINLGPGAALTLGGNIGGAGASSALTVSQVGSGVLTLSGANTYAGGTTVKAGGTVVVNNNSAFGTGMVSNSATIFLNGGVTVANAPLAMTGGFMGVNGSGSASGAWSNNIYLYGGVKFDGCPSQNNGVTMTLGGGTVDAFILTNASASPVQIKAQSYGNVVFNCTVAGNYTALNDGANVGGGSWRFNSTNNSFRTTSSPGFTMSYTTIYANSIASNGYPCSLGSGTTNGIQIIQFGGGGGGGTLDFTGAGGTSDRILQIASSANLSSDGTGLVRFTANLNNTLTGVQTFTLGGTNNGQLDGVIPDSTAGYVLPLTKNGSGTWTLCGVNTYSGVTTINAGTLVIGGAGQLDSGNYATNLVNNGAFNYASSAAQTLGGVISGTGSLTNSGSGMLTLTGTNTYKGVTTVSSGTLLVSGNSSGVTNVWLVASNALFGVGGTIGAKTVTLSAGAMVTNNQGSPLAISGALIMNSNTMFVTTPTPLAVGTYPLITYNNTGSSGSFNTNPVISGAGLGPNNYGIIVTGGGTVSLQVIKYTNLVATTTTVASSINPSVSAQSVTFTATVAPTNGTVSPTGTVQFLTNGVALGAPVAVTAGVNTNVTAAISTSDLMAGGSPYVVTAQFAGTGLFLASTGAVSGNQIVNKALAAVTLNNLLQTYDGGAQYATATTVPSGLTVNLTYNGSANAPTNRGSYTVIGTVSDANYAGSATNTLVISQGVATVILTNLVYVYDGTAKSATATTVPPGLTVNLTYNGSANTPTNVGGYTVIGTVSDANYGGSATNLLVIEPLLAALTWSGDASGNWNTTEVNWVDAGTHGTNYLYRDNDPVTFDNFGVTSTNITLNQSVQPGNIIFNNSTVNYTLGGSGGIAGTNSLTKNNSGTVTLNCANSYSGGTMNNSGWLVAGVNNALGTGVVSNNASIGLSNGLVATNKLVMTGGFLGLNGSVFGGSSAMWSNNIYLTGGVKFDGCASQINNTTLTLGGNTVDAFILTNMSSSPVKLNAQSYGNVVFNCTVRGAFTQLQDGANTGGGSWRFNSTNNTFTTTTVPGFYTSYANLYANNIASNGYPCSLGSGSTTGIQVIQIGGLGVAMLDFTGAGGTSDRIIAIGSSANLSMDGTGLLRFTSNVTNLLTGAVTFGLGGAGNGELDGSIPNSSSAALSLTKSGNGTWTLGGVNTYSGTTTVNGGELIGNTGGSCANSIVTVAPGANSSATSATNGVNILSLGGQWTCAGLTNTLGYIDFNFGSVGLSTTTAPLKVNGPLVLSSGTLMIMDGTATIANGQYPLIKYTGPLVGTVPFSVWSLPAGMVASLSNNVANSSIDLVVGVAGMVGYVPLYPTGNITNAITVNTSVGTLTTPQPPNMAARLAAFQQRNTPASLATLCSNLAAALVPGTPGLEQFQTLFAQGSYSNALAAYRTYFFNKLATPTAYGANNQNLMQDNWNVQKALTMRPPNAQMLQLEQNGESLVSPSSYAANIINHGLPGSVVWAPLETGDVPANGLVGRSLDTTSSWYQTSGGGKAAELNGWSMMQPPWCFQDLLYDYTLNNNLSSLNLYCQYLDDYYANARTDQLNAPLSCRQGVDLQPQRQILYLQMLRVIYDERNSFATDMDPATLARIMLATVTDFCPYTLRMRRAELANWGLMGLHDLQNVAAMLPEFKAMNYFNREAWRLNMASTIEHRSLDGENFEAADYGHVCVDIQEQMQAIPFARPVPESDSLFLTNFWDHVKITERNDFVHMSPAGNLNPDYREPWDYRNNTYTILYNALLNGWGGYTRTRIDLVKNELGVSNRIALAETAIGYWNGNNGSPVWLIANGPQIPGEPTSDLSPYAAAAFLREGWAKDAVFMTFLNFNRRAGYWPKTGYMLTRSEQALLEAPAVMVDRKPDCAMYGFPLTGGKTIYCGQMGGNVLNMRFNTSTNFDYVDGWQDAPWAYSLGGANSGDYYQRFPFSYYTNDPSPITTVKSLRQIFCVRGEHHLSIVADRIQAPAGESHEYTEFFALPGKMENVNWMQQVTNLVTSGNPLVMEDRTNGIFRTTSPFWDNSVIYTISATNPIFANAMSGTNYNFVTNSQTVTGEIYSQIQAGQTVFGNVFGGDVAYMRAVSARWTGTGNQSFVTLLNTLPNNPANANGLGSAQELQSMTHTSGAGGVIGFNALTADGASVMFQSGPQTNNQLTAGYVQATGESLLVVSNVPGQPVSGIGIGCTSFTSKGVTRTLPSTSASFEFVLAADGSFVSTTPIYNPIDTVVIDPQVGCFTNTLNVSFSIPTQSTNGIEMRYTLDGSDPTISSALYSGPFTISQSTLVKVRPFRSGLTKTPWHFTDTSSGRTMEAIFRKVPTVPALGNGTNGNFASYNYANNLNYTYYQGDWLQLFSYAGYPGVLPVTATGTVTNLLNPVELNNWQQTAGAINSFATRYDGYLAIPTTGVYTFYAPSNLWNAISDGGYDIRMFVDGQEWWVEPSTHARGTWSIPLAAGKHQFALSYVDYRTTQFRDDMWLIYPWQSGEMETNFPTVQVSGPGLSQGPIPASWLNTVLPPAVPWNLTATPGNGQVSLSWNAVTGTDSYNVKRSLVNGGPYTTITNLTGTSLTDTGLVNGTPYYYVVSATNIVGESANSAQATATPSQSPPNFSAGGVSMTGGKISLVATGALGTTYRLWATTNLALTPFTNHATLLQSGTITTSPFTNLDLTATNYPQRFYLFTTP